MELISTFLPKHIVDQLLPYERQIVEECLLLISAEDADFVDESAPLFSDSGKLQINLSKIPTSPIVGRILKLSQSKLTELVEKLDLVAPKLYSAYFCDYKEREEVKVALNFAEFNCNLLETLHRRFPEGSPFRFSGRLLSQIRQDVKDLRAEAQKPQNNKYLKWNSSINRLDAISQKLFRRGITPSEESFANVFRNQEKCQLLREVDFFIALYYEMVNKVPKWIKAEPSVRRGEIGIADLFFCDNSHDNSKVISFKDRHSRLFGMENKFKKIKLEVADFLQEFE